MERKLKITLEIECTSPGKWGLDMASQDGAATVVHAHGEELSDVYLVNRIILAVEKIMAKLEGGAHEEFASARKGPEEL